MTDTGVAVRSEASGLPTYLEPSAIGTVNWPSASNLLSALLGPFLGVTIASRRETVYLTRAQQRIMNGALRDSLRIIA
jgi:hypothetical protein